MNCKVVSEACRGEPSFQAHPPPKPKRRWLWGLTARISWTEDALWDPPIPGLFPTLPADGSEEETPQ